MKKHPLNSNIKQQLESIQTSPSARAKEKLLAKLENHKAKAVNFKKMSWTVAALFYLSIGLYSYFNSQKNNSIKAPVQKTISYDTKPYLEKENTTSQSFTLEEKVVLPNKRPKKSWEGTPLLSVNTQNIKSFKSTLPKPSLASIERGLRTRQHTNSRLLSPIGSQLEVEIDSLMAFATKRIQEKNTLITRKAETTLKLLDAVEEELNHELFLKNKILGLLKNTSPHWDMAQNEYASPQKNQ